MTAALLLFGLTAGDLKTALDAFEKATEFELYSLNPKPVREGGFHGWPVLGSTPLKGDGAKQVRAAVEKGRAESDGSVAGCFQPRHGIRIVQGKKTYDLVICFECGSVSVYDGDERLGFFPTTGSPGETLNKVLVDAKVPLPKN